MSSVINLGFVSIHLYSICLMIAIIIGYELIVKESACHGFNKDDIGNMMFYAIVFGVIGARIYYCLFNLDYYLNDFLSIFKVWEGGLAIHGGIIFGALTVYIFCKKKNYNFLLVLDFIVVGLLLAQAIGRWGNFFNGEAHGPVTSLSYLKSLYLPKFIIDGMFIDGNYYIPTFLYESLWCFLGFIILYLFRHKSFVKVGYVTGFYFIWYSICRFFVESLRTDSLMLFSLKMAQVVSIFMFVIGIFIIIYSYFKSDIYRGEKYD